MVPDMDTQSSPRTHQTYARQQAKGRRHLMDLDAPRTVRSTDAEDRSLTKVQRWVMSTLAVSTLLHMSGAAILAAMYVDNPSASAHVGLSVIAGAFGVMAVAAGLGIHGRRVLSPWLLLGLAPIPVGLFLTFG